MRFFGGRRQTAPPCKRRSGDKKMPLRMPRVALTRRCSSLSKPRREEAIGCETSRMRSRAARLRSLMQTIEGTVAHAGHAVGSARGPRIRPSAGNSGPGMARIAPASDSVQSAACSAAAAGTEDSSIPWPGIARSGCRVSGRCVRRVFMPRQNADKAALCATQCQFASSDAPSAFTTSVVPIPSRTSARTNARSSAAGAAIGAEPPRASSIACVSRRYVIGSARPNNEPVRTMPQQHGGGRTGRRPVRT